MFSRYTAPRRIVEYPAERKCIVHYYSDEQFTRLLKSERGAYMSKAILRATDRLMSFHYYGAVAAQVLDEETNVIAATVVMRELRFIFIEITALLTQTRLQRQRPPEATF